MIRRPSGRIHIGPFELVLLVFLGGALLLSLLWGAKASWDAITNDRGQWYHYLALVAIGGFFLYSLLSDD